ncbi:L-serine ammonia-lyase, iron-sulfur-dependent, subunit alpha [Vibrio sp. D404a]|uniref:L-cysteine desulfidase family protein n=1 Tax=unclassified Vibrio TaxID=2614977 RepID=UPI002554D1E0|nr:MULTISPECIES: L-serine ammonia-lyase, iron-sulfur-dependent, subunit alpha [unclassified Vibrio]MDK9739332.1 L-serine ammonia-lyase, iron-sulfur-dependent, subunit alpha [Vibrio sp. D404a]MDK9797633.1 L-serine ammonia-lyase, iron-sulfur-dependent, subunit alpha [Vibrio sp. D449a]
MKKEWQQYIEIIKQVVKPALGCTEPISAAYASAVAAKELGNTPDLIEVFVSDNLYKNSMGVYVPGTGKIGLPIAAAAGALGGDADAELEVLAGITPDVVEKAQKLIDEGKVKVNRVESDEFIYCSVVASYEHSTSIVTVSGGHTNIIEKYLNGNMTYELKKEDAVKTGSICDGVDISIEQIYDFALNANYEDISFILDSAVLNQNLSNEGLRNSYGLEIGRTIKENVKMGILTEDLMTNIQMITSAASDARMGGATLPAMSNFGSGNQGIAATLPVVVAADFFECSEEQLVRALIMSHLGAIYIKSHYPPLSAFCGNTVTSSAAAMAMTYLAGGTFEQACYAIQNVISDSSGMVCDGAKSSCAMKVCTSSTAAARSFMMALQNKSVSGQGIVAKEVEQTIKNVGEMVSSGMLGTDATIIDIMSA